MQFDSKYKPAEIEPKWYEIWEKQGFFSANEASAKDHYSIVIPPPNITGILHIGHALNNTVQDILIRYHRMKGFEALWIPGTDHAGIATQNVVEKKLAKEGKNRHQLGREQFLGQVWSWREQYGNTIIQQLKRLGSSCDWSRTRFTMDEGLSNAVREVFVRLFDQGLIYRGKRIINWCPRCETALSDEESEPRESQGHLWYIRYPIQNSTESIVVATTRPETMLGDTGIAVHPEDERTRHLIDKNAVLPLVGRVIPIVGDAAVEKGFGTGAVKVTPAHDPADFDMAGRHNLEFVQIMDTRGAMNENVPEAYRGLDRFQCRKRVLADLEAQGFLVKTENHVHNVGRCYRCDTVVEPYWSDQWFVNMKPLAAPAIAAVEKGEIRFTPERWTKVYLDWMHNIRDWCISRQIWWGHRIPVWTCEQCGKVFAAKTDPDKCPKCGGTRLKQDEDVLDTWFSSWLWPFSTMGWPQKTPTLNKFYPTDTLVTAPEILFFWVARMIMAGFYCMNQKPFSQVLLHGTVRDETGKKMSKSLGNSIDPLEIIGEYGADALRFSLIMITAQGQDVFLSKNKFEMGRNFANKVWNATRLVLSYLSEDDRTAPVQGEAKQLEDRWILSRCSQTIAEVEKAIVSFRLNEAAQLIYGFAWHDFCDWYLEIVKPRLGQSDLPARKACRHVLTSILRMLHPFMPFLTEEIWSNIKSQLESNLICSPYAASNDAYADSQAVTDFSWLQEVIGAIRNIRGENNVPVSAQAEVRIKTADANRLKLVAAYDSYFAQLAKVKTLIAGPDMEKPALCGTAVVSGAEIYLVLDGLIDLSVERRRIEKEAERIEKFLGDIEKKLSNAQFVQNAPAEVVSREREKKDKFALQLEKLKENLKLLQK